MSDNVIQLPTLVPDAEVRELIKWLDGLTLAELQELREMWRLKNE